MQHIPRDEGSPSGKARTMGSRRSKILVIAGVILVLVLSYLSAVILIEGARNPVTLPAPQESIPDSSN